MGNAHCEKQLLPCVLCLPLLYSKEPDSYFCWLSVWFCPKLTLKQDKITGTRVNEEAYVLLYLRNRLPRGPPPSEPSPVEGLRLSRLAVSSVRPAETQEVKHKREGITRAPLLPWSPLPHSEQGLLMRHSCCEVPPEVCSRFISPLLKFWEELRSWACQTPGPLGMHHSQMRRKLTEN